MISNKVVACLMFSVALICLVLYVAISAQTNFDSTTAQTKIIAELPPSPRPSQGCEWIYPKALYWANEADKRHLSIQSDAEVSQMYSQLYLACKETSR